MESLRKRPRRTDRLCPTPLPQCAAQNDRSRFRPMEKLPRAARTRDEREDLTFEKILPLLADHDGAGIPPEHGRIVFSAAARVFSAAGRRLRSQAAAPGFS